MSRARRGAEGLGTTLRLLLAAAVSAVCLFLATRGVDWSAVMSSLGGAHPGWVFMVVAVSLVSHMVRAERWRVLLRPVLAAPYWPALSATYVGFGASMVLPLRLGEIVRPALFARRTGIGVPAALSSVVVERMFDMLFVMLCFVLVALTFDDLAPYLRGSSFPGCSVGDAKNADIRMHSGVASISSGVAASKATHSWVYKFDSGDFHVNCDGVSADGVTLYHEF